MTGAFDLMSNSIFDNIILGKEENKVNLNDIWSNNDLQIDDFPLIPNLEDFCQLNNISFDNIELLYDPSTEQPDSDIVQHDCMWSGTCIDKNHPAKKKFRYISQIDDVNNDFVEREGKMQYHSAVVLLIDSTFSY